MIDSIKYTIDGNTYSLTNNGDGTWSRDSIAPSVAGNYVLSFIVSENGIVTIIDSSNSLYETYLQVVVEAERIAFLEKLVPDFIAETAEFKELFEIENEAFDDLYSKINQLKADEFISTASGEAISRIEAFFRIVANGTLSQRRSYLISKLQNGNKLSEKLIKSIANTITGSDCIVSFTGSDELTNAFPGFGFLRVQVLSPDNDKDYRYEDIERSLIPLVPAHIKLSVVKYFALWQDARSNFADWKAVKNFTNWEAIKNYIPPM